MQSHIPTLAELEECREKLLFDIEEIKKEPGGPESQELKLVRLGLSLIEEMIQEFREKT